MAFSPENLKIWVNSRVVGVCGGCTYFQQLRPGVFEKRGRIRDVLGTDTVCRSRSVLCRALPGAHALTTPRTGGRVRRPRPACVTRVNRVGARRGRTACRRSLTDTAWEKPSVSNRGQAAGDGRADRTLFCWLMTCAQIRFFKRREGLYFRWQENAVVCSSLEKGRRTSGAGHV